MNAYCVPASDDAAVIAYRTREARGANRLLLCLVIGDNRHGGGDSKRESAERGATFIYEYADGTEFSDLRPLCLPKAR